MQEVKEAKPIYCPICSSQFTCPTKDIEFIFYCNNCTHMWDVLKDKREPFCYDRQYYEKYKLNPLYTQMQYMRLGFIKAICNDGKLLDIGCGDCYFADLAEKNGYTVSVYDPSIKVIGRTNCDISKAYDIDVATLFGSIEHMKDPYQYSNALKAAMYVVVSIPDRPVLFPMDKQWSNFKPGEHYHWFSEESLSCLFHNLGKIQLKSSDYEDVIRITDSKQHQSVMTYVYK